MGVSSPSENRKAPMLCSAVVSDAYVKRGFRICRTIKTVRKIKEQINSLGGKNEK